MKQAIRNLLVQAGVEEEQIEPLLHKLCELVGHTTVPKADFNKKIAQIKAFEEMLEQENLCVETLKRMVRTSFSIRARLENLQDRYDRDIERLSNNLDHARFDHALDLALCKAGAREPKAVRALLNVEKLHFSDENGVQGLEIQLQKLKVTDGYLFCSPENQRKRQPGKRLKKEHRNSHV